MVYVRHPRFKLFLYIVLLNGFFIELNAQMTVNAGEDKVMCVNLYDHDTIILGGNPTADGGSNNYTYTWECNDSLSGSPYKIYSSYFLDDTTSSNPKVVKSSPFSTELIFYLTVIDNVSSEIIHDSVKVIFSKKYYFGGLINYLSLGDSVLMWSYELIGSELPVDSVEWFPKNGLSAPYSEETWAKPIESTIYTVYIMDSAGCEALPIVEHEIIIFPLSVNDFQEEMLLKYDRESNSIIMLSVKYLDGETKIIVYDINGQILINKQITTTQIALGSNLDLLLYIIVKGHSVIRKGKILTY